MSDAPDPAVQLSANELNRLERDAEDGNAAARYNLAVACLRGDGLPVNRARAKALFEQAAAQGLNEARRALGYLALGAWDEPAAREDALDWFRQAGEGGDAESAWRLGSLLAGTRNGADGPSAESLDWLERAAVQGHPEAALELAYCLETGFGRETDMRTAGELYQAAAEKGQPEACFRLADAFARGEVVEADPILAEAWLHRAAAHGHLVARTQLEKMNIAPRPGGPVSGSKSWRAGTVAGDSVEVLCESPRIVRVSGFLNAFECAHVIQRAAPLIRPSQVLSRETGKHEASAGRRSGEARLAGPLRDVVVRRIEERLAAYAGLPVAHGERLQVLHYGPGDEYRPHVDYFDPALPGSATPLGRGGQRLVTQLCYLNDVAGGGATAFPKLGIACEARPGSMLMFFNAGADAKVDPRTQHAGLPVTAGEKWLATKWVRQLPTPAF